MGAKPYRSIEGDASTGLLILCDHAENTIPEAYGTLGLKAQDLHRHIAYDLGAAAVAERLAEALGAPAILSRFSRLLIDPNRGLDDPTLVMQISDGLVVPGNVGLGHEEIEARIEHYYQPYHQAIERAIEAAVALGKPPVIVSMHSFTQAWKGVPRPWSVGVLWDKDPRLALALLDALRAIPGIEVGDNVPYSGQLKGDTLYRHGTKRGLAHALVEIRQDLILAPEGQAEWGSRLAHVLRKVLSDASSALHAIELHGSLTDGVPAPAPLQDLRGKDRRSWTRRPRTSSRRQPSGVSSDIFASGPTCRISISWSLPASAGIASPGGIRRPPTRKAFPSARKRRGRSSMAWPTTRGRPSTRRKPKRSRASARADTHSSSRRNRRALWISGISGPRILPRQIPTT